MTTPTNGRHSLLVSKHSKYSNLSNATASDLLAERENGGQPSGEFGKPTTHRDRIRGSLSAGGDWLRGFFVPPQALVEAPPGWSELTAYAHRGSWTKDGRSFLRGLGTLWLCLVALPTVARARIKEWVLTRPSRGFFFVLIAELILRGTPLGHWVSDNVIRQWFQAMAWIFLP